METIDIRCPEDPRHLFLKLKRNHEDVPILPGNLIELACYECRKTLRRDGEDVVRVLHIYDLTGTLLRTEIVRPNHVQVVRPETRANPS